MDFDKDYKGQVRFLY